MSADISRHIAASPVPENPAGKPVIRIAEADDAGALALLVQELLAFYGLPARHQRSYMAHIIKAGLLGSDGNLRVLLAELDTGPAGFLAYTEIFALASCQRSFFIQDLFVTRRCRTRGVGTALMGELLHLGEAANIAQIDWTADPWNETAMAFYERFGPLAKSEKLFYRLSGQSLRRSMQEQKR